jgi:hypothetical protein
MVRQAPSRSRFPTKSPQAVRGGKRPAGYAKPGGIPRGSILASGNTREAKRTGAPVIELEHGITVYLPRGGGEQGRWRAVWQENGKRQQCEAVSEDKLAARLEKVAERLAADAPNMILRGADLIAYYLSGDRLPVQRQWSRKHAHTQRRLCERFAIPVIAGIRCEDITTRHMQQIVNAAPTPGEGARVRGMIGPGLGRAGRRVPGQRAAGAGALAGRGPRAAPTAGELRGGVGLLGGPRRGARRR